MKKSIPPPGLLWLLLVCSLYSCSQVRLRVTPGKTYSGEIASVHLPENFRSPADSIKVIIDDITADILEAGTDSVQFLVPETDKSKLNINVFDGREKIGSGTITILPHPSRQVTFYTSGEELKVIGERPSNDIPDTTQAFISDSPFMLFEFRNKLNSVLLKGEIQSPPGSMEIFPDSSGAILRQATLPTTFTVTVPNVKGNNTMRFFKRSEAEKADFTAPKPWKILELKF